MTVVIPQGGIIKYLIRRRILQQGFAFADAWAVFQWVSSDQSLARATVTPAGIDEGAMFNVSARRFIYISEANVAALRYCSSPFFLSKATGGNALLSKDKMFAFCPAPNPPVFAFPCQPAHLGFATALGNTTATDTPYQQATLNLVADGAGAHARGLFAGLWRTASCACASCLFADGTKCTSRGSHEPVPWVPYKVTRAPRPPGSHGNHAFIARMVDGLIAGSSGPPDAFASELGKFIRERLHRFRSTAAATSWVTKRASFNARGNWVERWIVSQSIAVDENAEARASAVTTVASRAAELGWQLPRRDNGQQHSWESYFLFCRQLQNV